MTNPNQTSGTLNTSKPTHSMVTALQNWGAMAIAALIIVAVFCVYRSHFPGDWSTTHSVWGEFGDFMGGVINPLIGLCTIWLLTVSLKQSNLALAQANAELELTRTILASTERTQLETVEALKSQITQTERLNNRTNVITLFKHLNNVRNSLIESQRTWALSNFGQRPLEDIQADLALTEDRLRVLGQIMGQEYQRVVEAYRSND